MNEAIINPLWIYLIDVLSGLYNLVDFLSFILTLATLICGATYLLWRLTNYDDDYDNDVETNKKVKPAIIKLLIITIVINVLGVLIPSEKTMYTMFAASYVTEENIDKVGNTVTDMVDYIFDKVDELQEDNE